jgi:hypothetical protein
MNANRLIAEWPRNAREVIRIRLDTFNGHDIVDLRTWFRAEDGSLRPGRAGLTLSTRHLPALADALTKALASASDTR